MGRRVRRPDQHRGTRHRAVRRVDHRLRRGRRPGRRRDRPADGAHRRPVRGHVVRQRRRRHRRRVHRRRRRRLRLRRRPDRPARSSSTSRRCSPTAPTPTCGCYPRGSRPRSRRWPPTSGSATSPPGTSGGVWTNQVAVDPAINFIEQRTGDDRRVPPRLRRRCCTPSWSPTTSSCSSARFRRRSRRRRRAGVGTAPRRRPARRVRGC